MEYVRWLVKKAFGKDPALILPIMLLAAIFTGLGFALHPIVGALFVVLDLTVFGTIAYVFASDAFKASYEKFQKERSKP